MYRQFFLLFDMVGDYDGRKGVRLSFILRFHIFMFH